MKGVYRRNRSARLDLVENFRNIARRSSMRAARRFLAETEATFRRLASVPNFGASFEPGDPRFAGLRYCPVSRFKSYIVFYRPTPDGIEVLRVLHGSRDLAGALAADLDDEAEDEDAPEAE